MSAHPGAGVGHREEEPLQNQVAMGGRLELANEVQQAGDRVPAQFLGLDGNQVAVRNAQGGAGLRAEAGRAVDQDRIEGRPGLGQNVRERVGTVQGRLVGHLLGQGQRVGRDEAEILQARFVDHGFEREARDQDVAEPAAEGSGFVAQAAAETALGVEADQQDPVAAEREGRAQVHGRGRLADAALVADEADDLRVAAPPGVEPGGRGVQFICRSGRVHGMSFALSCGWKKAAFYGFRISPERRRPAWPRR